MLDNLIDFLATGPFLDDVVAWCRERQLPYNGPVDDSIIVTIEGMEYRIIRQPAENMFDNRYDVHFVERLFVFG